MAYEPVILAAEGWDGITNMMNSIKIPATTLGISTLTVLGVVLGIKAGFRGKGNIREVFQELGIWGFSAVFLGLASFAPAILVAIGTQIGNSSNGGPGVSNVQGQ
ncbi:hypothetical protein [Nocardia sp. NPDC052566]|uniref:hypothetical protein n=1 Tax=Nocardia sp. NPDC052566 TaxID=3364330 RepID=UPI0037C8E79F